jgi:RNA polymerase sigma-70 factor (ECF subfamily)
MVRTREQLPEARLRFEGLVHSVEPRLRAAFVGLYGPDDGRDATAEALAHAWEHLDRVLAMDNPAGYLFRVGQSRSRRRQQGFVPVPAAAQDGDPPLIEPKLAAALARLTDRQRVAAVLHLGYRCSIADTAELMGVSRGSVQRHLDRARQKLRHDLGVTDDVG